jgi:hypothetical protein
MFRERAWMLRYMHIHGLFINGLINFFVISVMSAKLFCYVSTKVAVF